MQQQPQQPTTEIGNIGILNTALLASAGVSFAVGVAPLGATLIGVVAVRTAWRWHRDGIVAIADRTLTDSIQTYHTVKALPKTAKRIASAVQERTRLAQTATTTLTAIPESKSERDVEFLSILGDKIHLLVVGSTGGGKSVLLHSLAKHIAVSADVLVCDVDSISGEYPGYRVVGSGDDYDSIGTALQIVKEQVTDRRHARANGTRSFRPMWLFIDEAHDVFANVEGARALFIDIVRRGRKLNIHAVIGTQDDMVKTLGLERQSKTLINLTRIDVALIDGQRVATIDGIMIGIPTLQHPDDMVSHSTDQSTDRSTDQSETALDRQNDALLEMLLKSGLPQSNGIDHLNPHQTSDRSTDQSETALDRSVEHVQTTLDRSTDQSETALDETSQTAIDQEIRSKLEEGMSKNAIWEWLRERDITRSKGAAYQMIKGAVDSGSCS